jgi:hypothetical protein
MAILLEDDGRGQGESLMVKGKLSRGVPSYCGRHARSGNLGAVSLELGESSLGLISYHRRHRSHLLLRCQAFGLF